MNGSIKEIYNRYVEQELLPLEWKRELYDILRSCKPEDLKTLEEHKMFLEALGKLRSYNAKDMELNGKKFMRTIESLLSVGNDGLYSGDLKFMYELIQNVDDCEFEDSTDCHLDVKFQYDPAPGKIIFTYNEKGFKPFNVFAITGIAEESKNIADKVEIGEKGIGFKSVFGVAEKVYIESGMFSFEIYKDGFTVPVPVYDNYSPIKGTRLTLFLDSKHSAKAIHKELLNQYSDEESLLNKNPILFLNKITHLNLEFDEWRHVTFSVQKRLIDQSQEVFFEDDVGVSVELKNVNKEVKNNIKCMRYTMPIVYDKKKCRSRYEDNTEIKEKRHNLIILFPKVEKDSKKFYGSMYSFLPTLVKTEGRYIIHVPYKLDLPREFVDPQGGNEWFIYTNDRLAYFLKKVYKDLARRVGNQILYYLPGINYHIFDTVDEKARCLSKNVLLARGIFEEKIFLCSDGSYESCNNVVAFSKDDNFENKKRVYELLGIKERLFIPCDNFSVSRYGIKELDDVIDCLFNIGMEKPELLDEIIDIIEKYDSKVSYENLLSDKKVIKLYSDHINVLSKHKKLMKAIIEPSIENIHKGCKPIIELCGKWESLSEKEAQIIKELLEESDLDHKYEEYMRQVGSNILQIEGIKGEVYIPASNGIVVCKSEPLGSFASLSKEFDLRGTFSATLQFKQATVILNEADESMSSSDYLKLLKGIRRGSKDILGAKAYESYISIVNNASSNKDRFLYELLQNADDCTYPEGEVPEFELILNGKILDVSYNEIGFTQDNVRAITAIGESTKQLLLNGNNKQIGEKGIGFKSVFSVAESVEIHSNGFDFKLSGKQPTIPEKCEAMTGIKGTLMSYVLKDKNVKNLFTEERILQACLCLRKLKKITVLGNIIEIKEDDKQRSVKINENKYVFEKCNYKFEIKDKYAISERESNHKQIDSIQHIVCYFPPKNYKPKKIYLYSGLPIDKIECNIPIVIDAPFELTTARDDILRCKWNEIVKENVYKCILQMMDIKKAEIGLGILDYVGYKYQINEIRFDTFSSSYLNISDWGDRLRKMAILPCYNDNTKFVRPGITRILLPDIILKTLSEDVDSSCIKGEIIDTRKYDKYVSLLSFLGCRKIDTHEEFEYFKNNLEIYLKSEKLRSDFYEYLIERRDILCYKDLLVEELCIYPKRTKFGPVFVTFGEKMYTHSSKLSNEDFNVLDTKVMSKEVCQSILGDRCNLQVLDQDAYDHMYKDKIENLVTDNTNKEEVAKYLLKEYKTNYDNFAKCQNILRGMILRVPLQMGDGKYCTGNKFFCDMDRSLLSGNLLKCMYVSEKYSDLARFLGCKPISTIHYSDVYEYLSNYSRVSKVSDDDVIDILEGGFAYYLDIISGMIKEGCLTNEQLEKFSLESFDNTNSDDYWEEEFPESKVKDWAKLKNHIKYQFKNHPNPYVKKRVTVMEPQNTIDHRKYVMEMYESQSNDKLCFCQMCENLVNKKYIETNKIIKQPKFEWEQMYLCLCSNCSKDYILLRNNKVIWEKYIKEISSINPSFESLIKVNIGNKKIAFTGVHFAEVQEIIKIIK